MNFSFSMPPASEILVDSLSKSDFTVLVGMGLNRRDDFFFIVPTQVVREVIRSYSVWYLENPKKDGGKKKDTGHWALHLEDLRNGEDRINRGLARKWRQYRDNWELLETSALQ